MSTHYQDKAYTTALTERGLEPSAELRALFDAGYATRGDHDSKAVQLLRKGGWVLPDRLDGFNLGIAAAVHHIGYVGGKPRRRLT